MLGDGWMPSNGLPLHLSQIFPPIIWIFTEDEGDGIKSLLFFKIFSTLKKRWLSLNPISYCLENKCIFILPRRALGNNDYVQFWYCVCTKAVKKILLHNVMGIWAEKGCWLKSLGWSWNNIKVEICQGPLITDGRNSK